MDRDIVKTFDHMKNLSRTKLITLCVNGTAYRTNCFVYLSQHLAPDRVMLTIIRPPQYFPHVCVNITLRLYGCGDSDPECRKIHALCSEQRGLQAPLEVLANDPDVSRSDICAKTGILYSSILVTFLRAYAKGFEKHGIHFWPCPPVGNC
jgi:hypothetical protein